MENVYNKKSKKEIFIKIINILCYVMTGIFILFLIIGAIGSSKSTNKSSASSEDYNYGENCNYHKDSPSYLSKNDEYYEISLTVEESSKSLSNFYSDFLDVNYEYLAFYYNDDSYHYDSNDSEVITYSNTSVGVDTYINFVLDYTVYGEPFFDYNYYFYFSDNDGDYILQYDLLLQFDESFVTQDVFNNAYRSLYLDLYNVYYDDINYRVYINENVLNTYVWNNFNNYLYRTSVDSDISADLMITDILYDANTYPYVNSGSSDLYYSFKYSHNGSLYSVVFNGDSQDNRFHYDLGSEYISFESYIVLNCDSEFYFAIKTAIQNDVYSNSIVVDDLFGSLTESLVGFINVLNQGISSVLNMFYSDGSLTVLGQLTVIVVAIAISYFLLRFIMGLTRLRG